MPKSTHFKLEKSHTSVLSSQFALTTGKHSGSKSKNQNFSKYKITFQKLTFLIFNRWTSVKRFYGEGGQICPLPHRARNRF